ncbi:PdaC/SigV domain-containing protein [Paenibacillus eucommiae]|uniref:DUF4163 domain-containing protein n=1 Tax=Paenibacillus eucommiae TaxID=1355755 RepID=A0ABS4J2M9_9BACL|nr:DUF4163 domain-containing protein [Paenibacillus eucommiae]MBP1994068.1 hypothetical protein [Paenibacillus eucommiae]
MKIKLKTLQAAGPLVKQIQFGKKGLLALTVALSISMAPAAIGLPIGQAHAESAAKLNVIKQPFVINGTNVVLPAANVEGSIYIGLRALNDQLGLKTGWDPETRTVTVEGRGRTMELSLNNEYLNEYVLNGQLIYGMEAIEQEGSTYLPLRFLLERMGYGISYDAKSHTVGIQTIKENDLAITTSAIEEEDDYMSLLVHYPKLTGFANEEVQQQINTFLKKEAETHAQAGRSDLEQAVKGNEEIEAENPDYSMPPVIYDGTYTVTYNENNKLSLYVDYYMYTGGAHGMTARVPYTFDLGTGELITLKEAAQGNANYVSIINKAINSQIAAADLPLLEPFESIEPDREFYLKHNGITIYFSQYEYTPYAAGMPEFEIPFEAFK